MDCKPDLTTESQSFFPLPNIAPLMRKKILLVDDDFLTRNSLQQLLHAEGYGVTTATTAMQAIRLFEENRPDCVILDIHLPDSHSLTFIKIVKQINPSVVIVAISDGSDMQSGVEAMKMGAIDYLEHPLDHRKILSLLEPEDASQASITECVVRSDFVYQSQAMTEIFRVVERLAAKEDVTVLVLGESGTGKSFLCRTLHEMSSRRGKPFVEIGCSNIPEHLIESELFGYEKGSFTDAKSMKKGLIEMADGGTVFFDEIGDMPYAMQSKLLSLIEERKFRRIGGLKQISANVRIVAATNRSLHDLVQQGKFRLDLYYRLNVVTIEMPPLNSRRTDIPMLIEHYLRNYSSKYGCVASSISHQAIEILKSYAWPGNVRELKNLMEKLVIMSKCERIDVDDLPPNIVFNLGTEQIKYHHVEDCSAPPKTNGGTLSLKVLEEESIRAALKASNGNQRQAAKLLDITRDTLRYRMKKFGINASKYVFLLFCIDWHNLAYII